MASVNAKKCAQYLSSSDFSPAGMMAWAACKMLEVGGTDVNASAIRPGADVVAQLRVVLGDHKVVTDVARVLEQVDSMIEKGM